jgi:glycosyltransferase involved in cell wall biosynthesis
MGLLEAAACGVPAVASRIGAIPELVAHGKTGLLSDPDNIADMVASVRWAWSHPRETEEMGRAARRRFLELFSAERSYESWMNVCQSVLH